MRLEQIAELLAAARRGVAEAVAEAAATDVGRKLFGTTEVLVMDSGTIQVTSTLPNQATETLFEVKVSEPRVRIKK